MRFIFLIPDFRQDALVRAWDRFGDSPVRKLLPKLRMCTNVVSGGTLNIVRHAQMAGCLGVNAVLATRTGRNTYGAPRGVDGIPFIAWSQRRPEDVCIVPDIYTAQISSVKGFAVAYLQSPVQVRNDFDYAQDRVALWTDSPFMLELCRKVYPAKTATMVPNVIDNQAFPFIPQSKRRKGELVAFPRKGESFIHEAYREYQANGGSYWKLALVHGLTFPQFAARMRTPQAFLASGDIEGCALPPMESMAAGIAVVGRDAGGANFYMRHRETALVANDPVQAAQALSALEDDQLREHLVRGGYEVAKAWFPEVEPTAFWKRLLAEQPWR
jgi:hypothetical protein